MERLAVLASGNGTDFQSILDHINLGVLQGVKPVLLICNNVDAFALTRARKAGVKTKYIEGIVGKKFSDLDSRRDARRKFDSAVIEELKKYVEQHGELEKKLEDLNNKSYLTAEQEIELKRLKKMKLAGRDKIEKILKRYRQNN